MIILLSGLVVVVSAVIVVIVATRPRYDPTRGYEMCDGWLIEHTGRHTFIVHCPDCDWHLLGSHHVDGHLTSEEAVEFALKVIRETGIHQHQHQEDL